ncbi:hypothetical protein LTR09_011103 [Extremus antarcticus]|uniref:NAD(P)-binding protein n=1 Tax=Extremus antarcticus TaxID=702011 RepID=A0AAJ0G7V0_9PEZI|nr:hypothetical protein LTR09_011103 [Extremus antarcticus]
MLVQGLSPEVITEADGEDWWRAFEVNVKGTFKVAQSFLSTKNSEATFINISAGSIQVPHLSAKLSAYNASKFAALKLVETLGVENPSLYVVSMHPGVSTLPLPGCPLRCHRGERLLTSLQVQFEMSGKIGLHKIFDAPELPGHFAVWLCSEEAKFLRGRFVWCTWNASELLAERAMFEANPLLTTANCIGWPYSP